MPLQGSLFSQGAPAVAADATWQRIDLDDRAWIDVAQGWLSGSDDLFDELMHSAPWRQGSRRMYDDIVDDPRLSWRPEPADEPPAVSLVRDALQRRYRVRFGAAVCNFYRDGRDSVAFHRDRVLRDASNALVAIVSLGAPRSFRVRPLGGGASVGLRPHGGDLLVMGGTVQRSFEHAIPKCASVGPRISISLRWHAA
ncbi:MAG: hypothetical protein JWN46_964 [Acidimicrobiales bacterium]|nr:hypothetical protein [Acidimicrobiales bacterium]